MSNPFTNFHEQTRQYALSRVRDRVKGNQNREAFQLRGGVPNTTPKPEPQGSFTQLFYNYHRPEVAHRPVDFTVGGFRAQNGQQWGQSQLKKRATQLEQQQAIQMGQMGPMEATARTTTASADADNLDSVMSSLELFFTDVRDSDFIDDVTKLADIRQALGNIRKYGVDISKDALVRFTQIMEVSLGTYIKQMREGFDPEPWEQSSRGPSKKDKVKNLIRHLEYMDQYELLFKVYLCLVALQSTIDLPRDSRKVAFTQQYQDIIRAKTSEIAPREFKEVLKLAQQGIKELKNLAPSSVYNAVKKAYPSKFRINKDDSDDSDDSDGDSDGDSDDGRDSDGGVAESKQDNTKPKGGPPTRPPTEEERRSFPKRTSPPKTRSKTKSAKTLAYEEYIKGKGASVASEATQRPGRGRRVESFPVFENFEP